VEKPDGVEQMLKQSMKFAGPHESVKNTLQNVQDKYNVSDRMLPWLPYGEPVGAIH
jgi:hypothetical protein